MPGRFDDLGTLDAAHPLGHLHAFRMHVLQAVALHFLGRPLDGSIQRGRAAQTVADGIGEDREALPGERAADRFADQDTRGSRG